MRSGGSEVDRESKPVKKKRSVDRAGAEPKFVKLKIVERAKRELVWRPVGARAA